MDLPAFGVGDPCPQMAKILYLNYACGPNYPMLDKKCWAVTKTKESEVMVHHSGIWGKIQQGGPEVCNGMVEISNLGDWQPYGRIKWIKFGLMAAPNQSLD